MCVWVMNKNLSGLQRMPPRGLVTSKRYPFNDGQKLPAHPNMAKTIWTPVKELYNHMKQPVKQLTAWTKQWNN